jgi:hypothetical protein
MTVYLVLKEIPWQGEEIVAIYEDEDDAEDHVVRAGYRYQTKEWEVIPSSKKVTE